MKPLLGLLLVATAALADDRSQLISGVDEIAAPGVPGPLCVYGRHAFVVASGGLAGNLQAPVVAAARFGRGRIVAFGHPGYLGRKVRETARTGRLFDASVAWAGRGRQAIGYRVPGLASWDGAAIPHGTGVIVMNTSALEDETRYATVDAFVRNGGGLVLASLGWGWKQLHPGQDLLTQHPGNRFLRRAGIVWADGYLERTSPHGFRVHAELPQTLHALAALRSGATDEQAVSTLTAAIHSTPADDTLLLPDLRAALASVELEAMREVTVKDGLARVAFAAQILEANRLPPELVRAHPWADRFPGRAPGETVRRAVIVDTSIPRWHSTGLYARAGTVVSIRIPEDALRAGLAVRIGAHSDRLWQKPEWQRAPEISRRWPLAAPVTKVASAFGGLLYVEVPDGAPVARFAVEIGPAVEAPRFVLGRTRIEDWPRLRALPGPWAELESDRLIVTVPSRVVRTMDDPRPVMEFWNRVLDASADLAARPRKRRSPERFVVDKQLSVGYMHAGYPLMAHLDAAAWLASSEKEKSCRWGLFHEIGHAHQHPDWTFPGTTEVTANLFTLYAYEAVCRTQHPHASLHGELRKNTIRAYRAGGARFSEWSKNPFLALLIYMQLQEAFGWDAYKRVFAEYRSLAPHQRPKSDLERRDQWMVRFSRRVGRDLGPFFEAWGIPTSKPARDSIAELPAWMPADWPAD